MSSGRSTMAAERVLQVRGLELPAVNHEVKLTAFRGPAPTTPVDQESHFVDAGSLVSFVAGIKAQSRVDVLHSTLLAQLAADKAFDRLDDTEKWYRKYVEVLQNVGWQVQDVVKTEYSTHKANFDMDKAVLEILTQLTIGNQLGAITAAIEGAKKLADNDQRLTLFERSSSSGNKGSFQIGVASEEDGQVVMKMGAFFFETDAEVTRFLWFRFQKNKTRLFHSIETATLDGTIYDGVRQTVAEKLGERTTAYVGSLDI